MLRFLYIGCFILLLIGCAGKEVTNVDSTPPEIPVLFSHLGDSGDGKVFVDQLGDSLIIDELNNGIDALPIGHKIKIQWRHVFENDLKLIRVFRFARGEYPVQIDSISPTLDSYEDSFNNIGDLSIIETEWSYFIHVVDHAGNYSISDTVSYRLIEKAILNYPDEGAILNNSNISFKWTKIREVEKFRLLLFDEFNNYVWHRDLDVALEDNVIELPYNGLTPLAPGIYYWRVDAFRDRIEGGNQFFSGSESVERRLVIE